MRHLSDQTLSAHLDGALTGRAARDAERHLAACEVCRATLATLVAQDEALRPALTRDPGEAYFDDFATRVDRRIAAASAAQPGRRGFDIGRWLGSPRALAWAGGAAVVVGGAGLALFSMRELRPPSFRDRDGATRVMQPASPPWSREARKQEFVPPPARMPPTAGEKSEAAPAPAVESAPEEPPTPTAQDERDAPLQQAAPGPPRPASPGRAVEVRRNEAGQDVPVRPAGERAFAQTPPPAGPSEGKEKGQAAKRERAQPMALSSAPVAEPMLDATMAETESARGDYAFMKSSSGAANQKLLGAQSANEGRLCGEVRDDAGRPVVGAQVALADLGRTTTTDARGNFCITAPLGEHPLSVMAVGFLEVRRTVRVGSTGPPTRVTLPVVPVLEDKRASIPGRTPLPRITAVSPAERQDRYAELPDSVRIVVRAAQDLESVARKQRSASLYDAAATGWERALGSLLGGPHELETRWRLAQTRYLAWEVGPSDRRATAAAEALTAYTRRARPGPERDQAQRWLDQVRK